MAQFLEDDEDLLDSSNNNNVYDPLAKYLQAMVRNVWYGVGYLQQHFWKATRAKLLPQIMAGFLVRALLALVEHLAPDIYQVLTARLLTSIAGLVAWTESYATLGTNVLGNALHYGVAVVLILGTIIMGLVFGPAIKLVLLPLKLMGLGGGALLAGRHELLSSLMGNQQVSRAVQSIVSVPLHPFANLNEDFVDAIFQLVPFFRSSFLASPVFQMVVLGPLIEELLYRLVFYRIYQGFKRIQASLNLNDSQQQKQHGRSIQGHSPQQAKVWRQYKLWAIVSSLAFGVSHLSKGDSGFSSFVMQRVLGPWSSGSSTNNNIVLIVVQAVGSFFFSLKVLIPVYHKAGLAGSFGVHMAWNALFTTFISMCSTGIGPATLL